MGAFAHVLKLDNAGPPHLPSAGQPLLSAERHLLQEGRGSQLKQKTPAKATETPLLRKAFLVEVPLMNNL